jgi:hypothetical protein
MNIDNFVTFLEFFKNAGHKLGATNPQGQTLADIASEHRHGREYVQALAAAGSGH